MTLNAYVKHKFDKGFLLRDEDLTKLLDFVKVRAAEVNAADRIKIKVYRSDSLVYESPSLEPLRAEENALRNRLTRVQVLLDHTELKVNFDFDAEENISIEIESTDRDRAYLLFSELKEYLNTEVLVLMFRCTIIWEKIIVIIWENSFQARESVSAWPQSPPMCAARMRRSGIWEVEQRLLRALAG